MVHLDILGEVARRAQRALEMYDAILEATPSFRTALTPVGKMLMLLVQTERVQDPDVALERAAAEGLYELDKAAKHINKRMICERRFGCSAPLQELRKLSQELVILVCARFCEPHGELLRRGISGKLHDRLMVAFVRAGLPDNYTWSRLVDSKNNLFAGVLSHGFVKVFRPGPTVPTHCHRLLPTVKEHAPYEEDVALEALPNRQISRPPLGKQGASAFVWRSHGCKDDPMWLPEVPNSSTAHCPSVGPTSGRAPGRSVGSTLSTAPWWTDLLRDQVQQGLMQHDTWSPALHEDIMKEIMEEFAKGGATSS